MTPRISESVETAVGSSSAAIGLTMDTADGTGVALYLYVANVASWIAQGASPTASAGSGSMYVPAGAQIIIDGALGASLAVIDDGSAGKCSLTPLVS